MKKKSKWSIVEDVPKFPNGGATRDIVSQRQQSVNPAQTNLVDKYKGQTPSEYKSYAEYANKRYGANTIIPKPGQNVAINFEDGNMSPQQTYNAHYDYNQYKKWNESANQDDKVSQYLKDNPIPKTAYEKAKYIEKLSPTDRQVIQNSSLSNEFLPAFRQYDNKVMTNAKNYSFKEILQDPYKMSEVAQGAPNRFRIFPNATNSLEDYINPGVWFGQMEQGLGNIPKNIKEENYLGATMGVVNPLLMGRALGSGSINPVSKNFWTNEISNKQFINTLVNPLAGTGDIAKNTLRKSVDSFHPTGIALKQIEKEGLEKGLSLQEIKKLQMEKVGITSLQREGYFPGVSEIASEYITPYSYEDPIKRILDIPKRIVTGKTNSKKLSKDTVSIILDGGETLLSKPRYDAWRMYSGLPQKNNTFRLAETLPLNHPSYTQNQLNNIEFFSLNNEKSLLRDLPNENTYNPYDFSDNYLADNVKRLKQDLKDIASYKTKGIDFPVSDFNSTNVMGGYNRRFFDNKMEYNDIWDLNLKGLKVDKYFGKPFMSHGQLEYSFDPAEKAINNLLNTYEKKIHTNKSKPVSDFSEWLKDYNNINIKKDLINKPKKFKNGGKVSNWTIID
jgi:hypothetical protein